MKNKELTNQSPKTEIKILKIFAALAQQMEFGFGLVLSTNGSIHLNTEYACTECDCPRETFVP